MDAWQYEHVYIQVVDNRQGDEEDDDKAAHDVVGIEEPHHERGGNATSCPDDAQDGRCALHGHDVVVAESVEDGDVPEKIYQICHIKYFKINLSVCNVATCLSVAISLAYEPVNSNRREAEDGAQKGHAQQGVHHLIQLQLKVAHLPQVPQVWKHNHHVLPRLGDAGDGVEGRQAADEAVHGWVKVPVPDNGHYDQQVLRQAHQTDGEEDVDGNIHLWAVWSVHRRSIHR